MCQTCQLDSDEFLKHEKQGSPPAISVDGELYTGTKSDLVTILKEYCEIEPLDAQPYTDFLMIDGSIFVYTNPPKIETISEYSKTYFWTHLSAISKSSAELCKCSCKKPCIGNCSCKQSSLPCTSR